MVEPAGMGMVVEVGLGLLAGAGGVGAFVWRRLNRVETNFSADCGKLYQKVEDVRVLVAAMNGNVNGTKEHLHAHEAHDAELHSRIFKDIGRIDQDIRSLRDAKPNG